MKPTVKEELNIHLGKIASLLRENLLDKRKVNLMEWNMLIAPKLCDIAKIIDGTSITPRKFKLPVNYFDE